MELLALLTDVKLDVSNIHCRYSKRDQATDKYTVVEIAL